MSVGPYNSLHDKRNEKKEDEGILDLIMLKILSYDVV